MYKYFKPEVISKIKRLDLIAKLIVEGFLTGLHKSPYYGFNVEFAEHRPYNQGDEIKYLDWKIFGKTDRFYIKQFEAETNLKSYILLDKSASMNYSGKNSSDITKLDYASYIASTLSYLMLKQNDSVGLVTFDNKIRDMIKPRNSIHNLQHILHSLENITPGRSTDITPILHILAEKLKRRGLIILISDLWDDPDKIMSGIKHLRHAKHEVIVFHILDYDEIHLPFKGPMTFIDLETGLQLKTVTENIRETYKKSIKDWELTMLKELGKNQIDYMMIDTTTSFDRVLLKYLNKRKRLYR